MYQFKLTTDLKHSIHLNCIYSDNTIRLEANEQFTKFQLPHNCLIFLFGEIHGIKNGKEIVRATNKNLLSLFKTESSFDKLIEKMEGHFVLLKKETNNTWNISCDQFGRADTYVQKTATILNITSDLSLLDLHTEKTYDQVALSHFFIVYGYRAPKKHTLYKNISRLGVGETARISNGNLTLTQKTYTMPPPH